VDDRPHYIPGYLRLASAHVLNKEMDLALTTLQNALKSDPKSKEAMQAIARIYTLKKDFGAAEEQLRRVVELDPGDGSARADLGDFLTAFKKYPEAEAVFRAITQRAPQNPIGYLKLARFYRVQGMDKEALRELEEGYHRNQTSAPLLTELIQTYLRQNKHTAAVVVCKKRLDDNPRDVFATNLLGLIFTEAKNYPEAEDALKKAIEMQPLWPVPHNNLAKLYLVQGRKNEAMDKFNAAIAASETRGLPVVRGAARARPRFCRRHSGLPARPDGEPRFLVRRQQPGLPARRDLHPQGGPDAGEGAGRKRAQAATGRGGHSRHAGLGELPPGRAGPSPRPDRTGLDDRSGIRPAQLPPGGGSPEAGPEGRGPGAAPESPRRGRDFSRAGRGGKDAEGSGMKAGE
jgi:Flp pilus assembly protein TadD